jgi:hypothetical protein
MNYIGYYRGDFVFIRLLLFLIALPAHATLFQMQSVEQQIKESDGIIIGHYLRKKSIQLDDGSIATQMFFKMNKEVGMQSELLGVNEVIIHYPGGKYEDTVVKVDGVPEFVPGEKVVLMIKSHEGRFWGMNLGFGSFKVVNYGNEKLLINTLFPEDIRVGQVRMDIFEKSVKTIKGSRLKIVHDQTYPSENHKDYVARMPASVEEGKNRSVASDSDQLENGVGDGGLNPLWLVLLLAVMGGGFRLSRQKEAK